MKTVKTIVNACRCSILLTLFLSGIGAVQGAPIPKLFNTGVDDEGKVLAPNRVDPHYKIIEIPDGITVSSNAFTLVAGFPVGPWIAEGPNSRWIAPRANQSTGSAAGNYIYRTTFDLTGLDPSKASITGRWVSDNGGVDILINGVALGMANPGNFTAWTEANDFSITTGFVVGINTLDFVVNNAGTDINPTGLRVEMRGTVELPSEPPSIVEQPRGGTVIGGDEFRFSVIAQGTPPLTYQWRRDSQPVAGATEPSLTLTGIAANQAGEYTVEVRNAFGAKTSDPVKLMVLEPITGLFNTGVADDRIVLDDTVVDPHYKIIRNPDGASPDAFVHDSTVFPIVNGPWLANTETSKWIGPRGDTAQAAGGDYTYRLTFALGDFDPTTVHVFGRWSTDNQGLNILVNGASTRITNPVQFGGYTSFVLTNGFVSGTNTIDFLLRNEGTGWTALRVDSLRGGAIKKVVTGVEPPRIVSQPQGTIALAGETVTLSVVADGTKPISYQWTFNGQDLAGKTESTLTLSNVTSAQQGTYAVVVRNAAGSIPSAPANVGVLERVSGLFNSGVGNDGQGLADGQIDPHYRLVANAHDPSSRDAVVEDSSVFPIVAGPWVPNSPTSKWIGPRLDPNGAGGDYTYETTFDLTGFDIQTARLEGDWATDNVGSDIVLNGKSTGLQNSAQFSSLTRFVITNGFVPGRNVIQFVVNNAGANENPTGLRVENLRLGAQRAQAAGPTLSVSRSGAEITLSWPSGSGLVLHVTDALVPANWRPVTETVGTAGDRQSVKIQVAGNMRFYRLQK